MPWWTFLTCGMGNWSLYCWLSGTSLAGVRCTRLVSKVSKHPFSQCAFLHDFVTRCQARKDDLDSDLSQFSRTHAFTKGLIEKLQEKTLWGDYGIVSSVVVRPMRSYSPLQHTSNQLAALHKLLWTRRHSQAHRPRFATSSHQRDV